MGADQKEPKNPFAWAPGRNPYVFHAFATLCLGPHANPREIRDTGKHLATKLKSGGKVELAGQPVDEFAALEALKRLTDARMLAGELLLAHPQPRQDKTRLRQFADKLRQVAALPDEPDPEPPALAHPLAIFWFVPDPSADDDVPAPRWEDFGLADPTSEPDRRLDVVFDR